MQWHYDLPGYLPEAMAAFDSLDTVFALEGQPITQSSLCSVIRVELDGIGYFVKRYNRAHENIPMPFVCSKARNEWSNLLRFAAWELPVARLVAWGEDSLLGFAGRGAVITQEVEGATDLAALAAEQAPLLQNPQWLNSISRQLAQATAVMHAQRFAHNDLKWRNVLVSGDESAPKITLIDCPAGTFWRLPQMFEYRRIKDLACLDKVARKVLRRTERLRFYRNYLSALMPERKDKLSAEEKYALKKIVHFFDGRE